MTWTPGFHTEPHQWFPQQTKLMNVGDICLPVFESQPSLNRKLEEKYDFQAEGFVLKEDRIASYLLQN